jgi:Outer membrane protein beta-barrel domain
MNCIKIYFRSFLIILFLVVCFVNQGHSQVTDTIKKKKPGYYFGLSIGPSQTNIKNAGTASISNLVSTSQSAFFGSVEAGYFFSKYLGLSSGVRYISYKSQLTLDTYQNNYATVDSEKDIFEMRVTGKGIKELQTVNLLSIPLCVNLQVPFSKKFGMYFKGGISMAFSMNQKYTSTGTFTYKGFYPAYNDLLENLPAYGFPTDKSVSQAGELKLKAMGLSPIISAGFDYAIQKKMQIAVGFSFISTSLGVKDSSTTIDKFQLSPDADHVNSFSGGSSKISASSMGFEISFKYFLK